MSFLLEMKNISKNFPGVKALNNVSINVKAGEVHALVGENGAGKSTLMKIMNGVHQPDNGEIFINGNNVAIENSQKALELGISIVFQELNLCDNLSVANNVFIGRMKNKFGVVDNRWLHRETKKILDSMGIAVDTNQRVGDLSIAEKQMIEIAKAVSTNAGVIVFDEPTSSLSENEINNLFTVISKLRDKGCGIFYISHRMEELPIIADRVTVLRDGQHISTKEFSKTTIPNLITEMVGRELSNQYPSHKRSLGETYFSAKNIYVEGVIDIDNVTLRRGEILGIAGLVGSGRTETMRAIFGADPVDRPAIITLDGTQIKIKTPKSAIENGIAYLTEDRKVTGLALTMDVEKNINMASHRELANFYVVSDKKAKKTARDYIKNLDIKTPSMKQKTQFLSGGNQQKVVLAKWLCRKAKLVIFDEPTRGIDIGAKYEIYKLMNELSDQGVGIIMVSSELPEILGMSDRILVFHNGKISGELEAVSTSQVEILEYATGQKKHTNFMEVSDEKTQFS